MTEGSSKDVFTISLHQENNYPFTKPPSSIDVNLPDGCSDAEYLAWLDNALSSGLRLFEPELICYVAGADPYCDDQLGGLNLSIDGLKQRDELVFRVARARDIPVMVTYAGGYANRIEDTVTIHCNTVIAAAEVYRTAASGTSLAIVAALALSLFGVYVLGLCAGAWRLISTWSQEFISTGRAQLPGWRAIGCYMAVTCFRQWDRDWRSVGRLSSS